MSIIKKRFCVAVKLSMVSFHDLYMNLNGYASNQPFNDGLTARIRL